MPEKYRVSNEYIAGFFDGEGTIYRSRQPQWTVRIAQCSKEVLEAVQGTLGYGAIYGYQPKQPHRSYTYWWYTNKRIYVHDFLTRLLPFLIVKKTKALEALEDIQRLGLQTPYTLAPRVRWTPEEDSLIRKNLIIGRPLLLAPLLPTRSVKAIRTRITDLRLVRVQS